MPNTLDNTFVADGTITLGDTTYESNSPNLNWSFTPSGSGVAAPTTQTITSGSWQPLQFTSSLQNGIYVTQVRNSGTASIKLASSNAGAGFNPVIPPGGWALLPFLGNVNQPLYATVVESTSGSIARSCGIEK